jgi:hypothetical protein
MIKKITTGFVIQTYDNKGKITSQEFVAGDQTDWENEDGESINESSKCEYVPMDMVQPTAKPKSKWKDNLVQFSRLIAEMESAGVFTGDIIGKLSNEMDLTSLEICELIERAQKEWEKAKAKG